MPVTVRNRARLRTSKGTVGRGFSPTQRQQLKADLLDYGREQVNGRLAFMGTWEGARPTFTPIVEEEILLKVAEPTHHYLSSQELDAKIKTLETAMRKAAKELKFEEAAALRDELRHYQQMALSSMGS